MVTTKASTSQRGNRLGAMKVFEGLFTNSGRVLVYAIMIGWSLISILSTGWLIMSSLKTNQELYADVWALPERAQWVNYLDAWTRSRMSRYMFNSILVCTLSVVTTNLVASMASYILARFRFRGSKLLLLAFVAGLAVPLQLILVPVFLMFNRLNLLNSLPALSLMYVTISLPFSIFVMTGFFRTLPRELEESAVLDGATEVQVFWFVMFPLARPGLITITIFNFLSVWNEYMLALFLLNDPDKMTVPVGIYNLRNVQGSSGDWVSMIAGLVIILIPTFALFMILQDRIVGGLTTGALKG